jgi:hypothetical protein
MSGSALPWMLAGGAAALAYALVREARREELRASPPRPQTSIASAAHGTEPRNAGWTYRPVGSVGEPYPDWVRRLDGKSGVYVIRETKPDGSSVIVYVGESHTSRLYQTLTRHFQTVRHEAKEIPMT